MKTIITGGAEKFANQSIKVEMFVARLKQAREAFLNQFLMPEIKRIAKDLGFKSYPHANFHKLSLKNDPNDLWYFIVLQIPKEIRIKRIKELYPDNYEDHIKNMKDISERGLIDFRLERTLYIANDTIENIQERINEFIS